MKTKKQIKLEHFANLIAVAMADGILTDEEIELLKERATDYGIDEKSMNEMLDKADELQFVIPLNQEEREEQLSDAVMMTMIDGNIDEKEYELCLKLAEKLDLNRSYLDHVIELTKKLWEADSK